MIDDEYPCETCDLHCDYWYSDNPDCEDCNPWDI